MVNIEMVAVSSFAAIKFAVGIVRCATVFYGFFKYLFCRCDNAIILRVGDTARLSLGVKSGKPKRFVDVNIAESRYDFLVK